MWTSLQYRLLKSIAPRPTQRHEPGARASRSKIRQFLGPELLARVAGRTVIDFGCGVGLEVVEVAKAGAAKVIGLDIREEVLELGRKRAVEAGVGEVCEFTTSCKTLADYILSIDSFEHFEDPAAMLRLMRDLLGEEGRILVSFATPWYHPYGGHLFSVFPWAHLVFSEQALLRWRADFRDDGARRFGEVSGGLNQMTVGWFERLVRESGLGIDFLETVPIRGLGVAHNHLTREFTTALIRASLRKV